MSLFRYSAARQATPVSCFSSMLYDFCSGRGGKDVHPGCVDMGHLISTACKQANDGTPPYTRNWRHL
ncbi:predicted protein [Lichtheimia corymbifera JMRC:FSU:9682]|uniref:Uncharacterized protein n=1 Tax=Lichtheimia corymbifera JMRC:FSU:9682 TaxID=1263082 RepID=A0A068S3V6_9FUNG|nr:predicted protein [Lichtheimia corymbifera JMRC:FSU:9682]